MTEIDISASYARDLTDRIKTGMEVIWDLIKEAYQSRAWTVLGYASWDDYCTREFGASRIKLPREERQEIVSSMREIGMSTRAIASATGVSQKTISRDTSGESFDSPAPVTGTDGKTYTPKLQAVPEPQPIEEEEPTTQPTWEEVAQIPPERLKNIPKPKAINIPQDDLDALNSPGIPLPPEPKPGEKQIFKPLDENYHNPKKHLIDLMSHLKKASKAIEDAIFTASHIDSWDGGPISGDLRDLLDQLDSTLNGGSFDAELARLIEGEKQ